MGRTPRIVLIDLFVYCSVHGFSVHILLVFEKRWYLTLFSTIGKSNRMESNFRRHSEIFALLEISATLAKEACGFIQGHVGTAKDQFFFQDFQRCEGMFFEGRT
jgi:hypothetical protein